MVSGTCFALGQIDEAAVLTFVVPAYETDVVSECEA